MEDQDSIRRRILELGIKHRDLNDVIEQAAKRDPFDQLKIQRLKKRKLELKDKIQRLKSNLIPDNIAEDLSRINGSRFCPLQHPLDKALEFLNQFRQKPKPQ